MNEEEVKRQRKALEMSETFFRTKKFSHTEKTRKLCPEAVGHFCMRWGDHGQGGFNSVNGGYAQGGQPMDKDFALWADLIDCYEAFEKAKEIKDRAAMRSAIRDLREVREFHSIDKKDERQNRGDKYEEEKPSKKRKVANQSPKSFENTRLKGKAKITPNGTWGGSLLISFFLLIIPYFAIHGFLNPSYKEICHKAFPEYIWQEREGLDTKTSSQKRYKNCLKMANDKSYKDSFKCFLVMLIVATPTVKWLQKNVKYDHSYWRK